MVGVNQMKKLKLTKVIVSSLVVASILALNPIGASATWKQDSKGWQYTEGNFSTIGWKLIDGNWYYFRANGYMAYDTTINGCYLNASGAWTNNISMVEKIKGTWSTSLITDFNVSLTITDNRIGMYTYTVVEESEDSIIIDVNKADGLKRYLIQITSSNNTENIIMYVHNDIDGYTEICENTRIN